jgi:hypothetical protein
MPIESVTCHLMVFQRLLLPLHLNLNRLAPRIAIFWGCLASACSSSHARVLCLLVKKLKCSIRLQLGNIFWMWKIWTPNNRLNHGKTGSSMSSCCRQHPKTQWNRFCDWLCRLWTHATWNFLLSLSMSLLSFDRSNSTLTSTEQPIVHESFFGTTWWQIKLVNAVFPTPVRKIIFGIWQSLVIRK